MSKPAGLILVLLHASYVVWGKSLTLLCLDPLLFTWASIVQNCCKGPVNIDRTHMLGPQTIGPVTVTSIRPPILSEGLGLPVIPQALAGRVWALLLCLLPTPSHTRGQHRLDELFCIQACGNSTVLEPTSPVNIR